MERENPPPPIFATDNDGQPSDTDIMRSYAIDTLFASEYYTKARAVARGDTLRRAMIKAQAPLPASYSPTIMPLTFSLYLQLAVIQKLHMATMDIKSAYLNAALPPDADWIVTTLEPHIAAICGLDPAQEYRIANALYGLPDSGRLFYQTLQGRPTRRRISDVCIR